MFSVLQSGQFKAFFKCSPIISTLPKVSEIYFSKYFRANFPRFKFSVYFRFSLRVFQNNMSSVAGLRIRQYTNINKSIRRAAVDQPEFNTIHSAYNKVRFDSILSIKGVQYLLITNWVQGPYQEIQAQGFSYSPSE